VLSIALMTVDHRTDWLTGVRGGISLLTTPVFAVANLPRATGETVSHWFFLYGENARLRRDNLRYAVESQRVAALEHEIERLRALLGSTQRVRGTVGFAEVIGLSPDPTRELLVIDKGRTAGVLVGDAVLDAEGVVGQIVDAGPVSSRVLMVTDLAHATPVQVLRNDLRAVLRGTGEPERLRLQHVPNTADVRIGDLLVTSGLGGRFPAGYPVAVVEEVVQDPTAPFAAIRARPTAQLARSRHLVLVGDRSASAGLLEAAPAPDAAESGS
jgi:rod shape-determining protein MreC